MDITNEIKKSVASVPADSDGYNVEVNLVSWNGREPKWEIRKWNEDHSKSGKGVTLSEDEIVLLFQKSEQILKGILGLDEQDEETEKVTEETIDGGDSDIPFN